MVQFTEIKLIKGEGGQKYVLVKTQKKCLDLISLRDLLAMHVKMILGL